MSDALRARLFLMSRGGSLVPLANDRSPPFCRENICCNYEIRECGKPFSDRLISPRGAVEEIGPNALYMSYLTQSAQPTKRRLTLRVYILGPKTLDQMDWPKLSDAKSPARSLWLQAER